MQSAGPTTSLAEKENGKEKEEENDGVAERAIASNAVVRKRQKKKAKAGGETQPYVFGGPRKQQNYLTIHNHHSPYPHPYQPHPHASNSSSFAPAHLSTYLHATFLLTTFTLVLYLLFLLLRTLRSDLSARLSSSTLAQRSEIFACSQSYTLNRCSPETRVPALEDACRAWERCMHQDPEAVGTARLLAMVVGETVNGFVDTVSWKSFVFILLMAGLIVYSTTTALQHFRTSSPAHPIQQQQQHAYQPPSMNGVMMTPKSQRAAEFLGLGLNEWEYRSPAARVWGEKYGSSLREEVEGEAM
ncbi:hypothetical protein BT69DRAFT_226227 [Atractiella rhizophila]|nr:hypothetical protein BT69DRAFT_226227 [Atractiella rhizophila]